MIQHPNNNKYAELRIRLTQVDKALIEKVSSIEGFGASGTRLCKHLVLDYITRKYPGIVVEAEVEARRNLKV